MYTAASQRCAPGEVVCGDAWVVVPHGDAWLLAVIDGLGHGPEAHRAAQAAKAAIERQPHLELEPLVGAIATGLKGSRGACVGLARVEPARRRVGCVIVGNVEIVGVGREPIRPLGSPGIVGREIRKLRLFEGSVAPGDRLFLYSDGISRRVDLARYRGQPVTAAARGVVDDFGGGNDDATCLVAELPP